MVVRLFEERMYDAIDQLWILLQDYCRHGTWYVYGGTMCVYGVGHAIVDCVFNDVCNPLLHRRERRFVCCCSGQIMQRLVHTDGTGGR